MRIRQIIFGNWKSCACTGLLFISAILPSMYLRSEGQVRPPYQGLRTPGKYNFPGPENELLRIRDEQSVTEMRSHAWMLFAGLTHAEGPEANNPPIWDSWYTKCDVKLVECLPPSSKVESNRERLLRGFAVPTQKLIKFEVEPFGPGFAEIVDKNLLAQNILEFIKRDPQFASVLYNRPAARHILGSDSLYDRQSLDNILKKRLASNAPELEREIPPFPRNSVVLKTVWQLVPLKKDSSLTDPVYVWNPQLQKEKQAIPGGRLYVISDWRTSVTIDTKRHGCEDRDYDQSEPIPIDCFYAFKIDKNLPYWDQLGRATSSELPRPGQYLVLVGVHVTTKETGDWVWSTFWWYNRASDSDYGFDRPPSNVLKGNKWRHFLMDTTLSGNTPFEKDYGNKICFNPYLEETQPNGLISNCIQCHRRAAYDPSNQSGKSSCGYDFALVNRCTETAEGTLPKCMPPSCQRASEGYYQGALQTDFLWSITEAQNPSVQTFQKGFLYLLQQLNAK